MYSSKLTNLIINNFKKVSTYFNTRKHFDNLVLGRWKIYNCTKKINLNIDNANTDHCGPCGNHILKSTKKEITKKL
jgi:hypothetical protein